MENQNRAPLTISMVVAVAQNGIIGNEGGMPWQLSTDMKRFRSITMGKPVIMGRKTYDSMGKALPGRENLVVSRSTRTYPDASAFTSLAGALDAAKLWCKANDCSETCIIGGGQIYREGISLASKLYVTHVLASPDGDTLFPEIVEADWLPVRRETVPAGEKDTAETLYVEYERKVPA